MSGHTPAPWTIDNRAIYGNRGLIKCFIASVEDDHNDSETIANARLISASPDLLDACRCALADLQGLDEQNIFSLDDPALITIRELQAAIVKATGEAV